MSRQAETARADAPTPTPPAGRMAAEERRLQIVRVAMRLFSERGFRGTTTKEIAHAAGVSEAIIFRHFATKEELYTAIIDYKACAGLGACPAAADESGHPIIEKIRACVGDAMERRDDREVFRRIALTMMEHHQADQDFLRLLLYSALEGHQLAQIFWDKNVRVVYEFLGGYVGERQREGAFRDLDPFLVVRAFNGAIVHHSLNKILWERDAARRLVNVTDEEAAREFTEMLMRGVLSETGGRAQSLSREKTRKRAAAKDGHGAARNKKRK